MKKFKIDFSFWLLIILVFFSPKQAYVLKLIVCLVCHELGHLFLVWLFRYKIKSVSLSIVGFMLKLEKVKQEFWKDLLIYSGGIIVNLLGCLLINDYDFKIISLILIIINLLPIYPLDGFNILKTIFSYFFPYYYVLNIAIFFSICVNVLVFILGIYYHFDLFILCNLLYLFIINLNQYRHRQELFSQFILDKLLYPFSYPLRRINPHFDYLKFFYRYHEVYLDLENSCLSQQELLQRKKLINC